MEYVIDLERIQGHNEYWEYKLYRVETSAHDETDQAILHARFNVAVRTLIIHDGGFENKEQAIRTATQEIESRRKQGYI